MTFSIFKQFLALIYVNEMSCEIHVHVHVHVVQTCDLSDNNGDTCSTTEERNDHTTCTLKSIHYYGISIDSISHAYTCICNLQCTCIYMYICLVDYMYMYTCIYMCRCIYTR